MTEYVTVQREDLASLLEWVKKAADFAHKMGFMRSKEFGPRAQRLQRAVDATDPER